MPRVKNPNRPKRGFLDGYKTYNPEVEGYGDSGQWRQAFHFRMGLDAAREAVGDDKPISVLGVVFESGWTFTQKWAAIKSAWRKLVRTYHPDNQETGDSEKFKKIQGAYEVLEDEYRRLGV
jgi:hypothetical protein